MAIPKRGKNPKPKALINPKWSFSLSGRSGRPKSFFQSPILFYCPALAVRPCEMKFLWVEISRRVNRVKFERGEEGKERQCRVGPDR